MSFAPFNLNHTSPKVGWALGLPAPVGGRKRIDPRRVRPKGGRDVYCRLWEWVTDQGVSNAALGVSGTRHEAMEALSKTLVKTEGPASGRVVPIALVDGRCGFCYMRLDPVLTATYEDYVIRWHKTVKQ